MSIDMNQEHKDIISIDSRRWKYLSEFLKGVNWYQIEGALVGTRLRTYDFNMLVDDNYINTFRLSKELSEGYITYKTAPPEVTLLPSQHITFKWKLFDKDAVHIFITKVEVCN